MDDRTDALVSSLAAVLVLFTAMLNPLVSALLAAGFLAALAIYKFIQSRQPESKSDNE